MCIFAYLGYNTRMQRTQKVILYRSRMAECERRTLDGSAVPGQDRPHRGFDPGAVPGAVQYLPAGAGGGCGGGRCGAGRRRAFRTGAGAGPGAASVGGLHAVRGAGFPRHRPGRERHRGAGRGAALVGLHLLRRPHGAGGGRREKEAALRAAGPHRPGPAVPVPVLWAGFGGDGGAGQDRAGHRRAGHGPGQPAQRQTVGVRLLAADLQHPGHHPDLGQPQGGQSRPQRPGQKRQKARQEAGRVNAVVRSVSVRRRGAARLGGMIKTMQEGGEPGKEKGDSEGGRPPAGRAASKKEVIYPNEKADFPPSFFGGPGRRGCGRRTVRLRQLDSTDQRQRRARL